MTKIKNAFILIGGILLVILYIIIRRDGEKDVKRAIIKNKIKRRKNTINDLKNKQKELEKSIEIGDSDIDESKKKLEKIINDRKNIKSELESEIKEMNDEELASELGDLLSSL